ncbi:MAG TPA: pseudouridine synthase [Methylophilaceae bacterium]|jgi:23S rRNA pseudouridine2604 synthase
MTTLKLSKKSGEAPTAKVGKAPVRRVDPAKRQRVAAPAKPSYKSEPEVVVADEQKPVVSNASQRNHRFDGKPRASTPDSRAPAERAVQRGEFKHDEFKRNPPKDVATGRDTPRRGGKVRDGFEQGSFNKDRATNPMFTPKPVASNPEMPRLSKRMAELGICSRREADEWIVNGWVKVDGVIIDTLGTRIQPDAMIEVSDAAHKHQAENVTILLNKPVGYVSGQAEDGYQPAITLIHPDNHWEEDSTKKEFQRGFLHGLAPAGRLDIDSTGLLVLTQDGRIARQLIGEDSTIEKEYLVRVEGNLSADGLKLLNFGLSLDGVKLKPAKVSWQNEDQLRFVLREGRKRQIRRMCELVGLNVVGLKRVRIGSVTLGRLPLGSWRYLRFNERF